MRVAVIGGGASGMMAAIAAAEEGAEVTLYEANDRVGKKLLVTGNGRCNFSNRDLAAENYYSQDKRRVLSVLQSFDTDAAIAFFEEAGMMVKDRNGCLYPASGQASTVLDILRTQLKEKRVKLLTDSRVRSVRREKGGGFLVETASSQTVFDSVVLACGGKAAPRTGSDGSGYRLAQALGHTLIPVVPALVQLKCSEDYLKSVSGVRLDAELMLSVDGGEAARERGELQFTDYGISGIVVFQFSRLAAYALRQKKSPRVYIDCLPELSEEDFRQFAARRMRGRRDAGTVEEFFTGMLNKKLMLLFIKLAGLKPGDSYGAASQERIGRVFALCKSFPLTVSGCNSFDSAQVCAGGVPLREVTADLESLFAKGLYLAGELLDADGKCGGYNLQWAWASGYVAGKSAANADTRPSEGQRTC